MIIWVSLLIAILGGTVYLAAKNPKYGTLGLWAFGVGLLAFLLRLSPETVSFLFGT